MQTLREKLYNSINESADKKYRSIFGMDIVWGPRVKDQLNKLGLNHDHEYDTFRVLADGSITYSNSRRMVNATAKLHPSKLNRIIPANSVESIIKFADNVEDTFDLCEHPYYLFRAVLNALTVTTYHITPVEVVIDDIDYTTGDYEKDKKSI